MAISPKKMAHKLTPIVRNDIGASRTDGRAVADNWRVSRGKVQRHLGETVNFGSTLVDISGHI